MFYDVTSFIYHTAEDLRLHCISSYWPSFYSLWIHMIDLGHDRVLVSPSNFMVIQAIIPRLVLMLAIVLGICIFLLKIFTCYQQQKKRLLESLHGRTVLITEGYSALGFETAKDMASRGARIIIACNNITKGSKAREDIIIKTGNNNVLVKSLDLSSMESVKQFAKDILETEQRLDILVLKSDIQLSKRYMTEEGLELHMAVNHLGPFLLSNLLLPILHKTIMLKRFDIQNTNNTCKSQNGNELSGDLTKSIGPSFDPVRVVIVSKGLHFKRTLDMDDLNLNKIFESNDAYASSKLANILFAKEFDSRLQITQNPSCFTHYHQSQYQSSTRSLEITVNVVNPEWQWVCRNDSNAFICSFNAILERIFYTNIKDQAKPIMYVAASEETKRISGGYFLRYKLLQDSKRVGDETICSELWKKSSEQVELDQNISLEYIL